MSREFRSVAFLQVTSSCHLPDRDRHHGSSASVEYVVQGVSLDASACVP